jgi:sugar phosphate isomerase/epimerase
VFDFAPEDLPALRDRLRRFPGFSVHAPLPTPVDYPGVPATSFLLDPDPAKRQASLDALRTTIKVASAWGARYVVVHFAGLHSRGMSPREVTALADDSAARLNALGERQGISLHLEYAAYNPSLAEPEHLVDLVQRYPMLGICLDVGHVRISAEMLGADEYAIAEVLAPHTRSMHLWTTRGREDARRFHHVPVHPSLTPAAGWIDIRAMLALAFSANPACGIVFEPSPYYNPDPVWQEEGMAWVRGLVSALSR